MKTTILIMVTSLLLLTGCNVFQTKQTHTTILVETVKSICGQGAVSVESTNKGSETEDESTFKFECLIAEKNKGGAK